MKSFPKCIQICKTFESFHQAIVQYAMLFSLQVWYKKKGSKINVWIS